jgi:hypothetical protein
MSVPLCNNTGSKLAANYWQGSLPRLQQLSEAIISMKEEIYESWPEEEQDGDTVLEKNNFSNRISSTTQRKFRNDQSGSNSDDIVVEKVLTHDLFESFQGKLYSTYRHVFNGTVKEDPILKIQRLQNELSLFEEDVKNFNTSDHSSDNSVNLLILNKIEDFKAELNDMKLNHPGYHSLLTKDTLLKKQLNNILSYVNEDSIALGKKATKGTNNVINIDEIEIENQLFQLETLLGVSVSPEESNLLYQKQPIYPLVDSINRIETTFSKFGKNPSIAQNINNKLVALKTSLESIISNSRTSSTQSNGFDIVEAATKINAIYRKYEKVNYLSNDLDIISSRLENVDRLKALSVDINARIGLTRAKIADVKSDIKSNEADFNQVKLQFNAYMNDFHDNVYKAIENEVNKYKKL